MPKGPLFQETYRPQFSGHETFPPRYGWLKKTYDAIRLSEEQGEADNKQVFLANDAIARFGVGKNMVSSMRHWASAIGVIADDTKTGRIETSDLGNLIFGNICKEPLDPYLEYPATLWLLHWQLCAKPNKTTWYWVFNHYPSDFFDRQQIVEGLEKLAVDRSWARTSAATIKRDVECFVRTYAAKPITGRSTPEDTLESPLVELGLIKAVGKRDGFRLVRGSKPSLGDGVFFYALVDFWSRSSYAGLNHLPFDAIAHAPGSPGRVFLLDENSLADRLMNIESLQGGALSWSETSGIKGVIKRPKRYLKDNPLFYICSDYK